jgi:hypothetical protein
MRGVCSIFLHIGGFSSRPAKRYAWALPRYLFVATLVRAADGGAAVGLVLLGGPRLGGLLAACLTAPHLLGPALARRLDSARDDRTLLAAAFAGYGVALAAAAALLGQAPAFAALAAACAGACGPLLTGGLSSRLESVARGPARDLRRAEGWDAVTYGIGGSAGPAAVAILAAVTSPLAATFALAGAAGVAALLCLTLPPGPSRAAAEPLPVTATLRALAGRGPLRRVGVATVLSALGLGGLPVIAVALGSALGAPPSAGAALVASFGLGNLAGSLLVTAFPLRGEPERLTARHVAVMGGILGLAALAPSYPLAIAAFAALGAANAPYFTATLAARARYAPPGARAQVFVSLAGAKVAFVSLGTTLAAAGAGLGARPLLAAAATLTLAGAALAVLDRRCTSAVP